MNEVNNNKAVEIELKQLNRNLEIMLGAITEELREVKQENRELNRKLSKIIDMKYEDRIKNEKIAGLTDEEIENLLNEVDMD